jgi:serine/threonine-protein kinase HipA
LLAADPHRRATLAGSQQKTSVHVRRGRLFNGRGNAPTTHVLKPDSTKLPHSTVNEAFCMKLAARVGMPVVAPALLQCGARLFVIARSDRAQTKGRIRRLHEIDFCQAGNFTSLQKYEKDGGPGVARLFELGAKFVSEWPREQSNLIQWVIFNYLIGNRDTHAKNLSLTIYPDRIQLTPFYDLLSTAVYPNGEKELSLKIGGQNRPHAVGRENWRRFARDIKVEWPMVEAMARNLSAALPRHAEAVAARMDVSLAEQRRIGTILRLITEQSRHLQETLA